MITLTNRNDKLFKKCLRLIARANLNKAYRILCKEYASMERPPGLYADWEYRLRTGLDLTRLRAYHALLSSDNTTTTHLAIYHNMSADSYFDIKTKFLRIYGIDADMKQLGYKGSILSCDINFDSYANANIEKYRFLSTLDDRTCPVCGILDGKIFNITEKKVGINCPPMHIGCRCTTVARSKSKNSGTRIARNPITHKNYYVPVNTTWSSWIKEFANVDN